VCALVSLVVLGMLFVFAVEETSVFSQAPTSPLKLRLSISDIPRIHHKSVLTATLESSVDVPEAVFNVNVPSEFKVLEGNLHWRGALTRDTQIRLVIIIEPLKAGEWVIEAFVEAHSATAWFTASDKLNVIVFENQTAQGLAFGIIVKGVTILLFVLALYYLRRHGIRFRNGVHACAHQLHLKKRFVSFTILVMISTLSAPSIVRRDILFQVPLRFACDRTSGSISPPIQVSLSLSGPLAKGVYSDLLATVSTRIGPINMTLNIQFPAYGKGVTPLAGTLTTFRFQMRIGDSIQFGIPVTLGDPAGDWTISASAGGLSDRTWIGNVAYLYLRSDGSRGIVVSNSAIPGILAPPSFPEAVQVPPPATTSPVRSDLASHKPLPPPFTPVPGPPGLSLTVTGTLSCYITDNNWGSGFPSLTWGSSPGDIYSSLNNRDSYVFSSGAAQLIRASDGAILDWQSIGNNGRFSLSTTNYDGAGYRIYFLPYTQSLRMVRFDGSDYVSASGVLSVGGDTGNWIPVSLSNSEAPNFFAAYRIYNALVSDNWYRGAWNWLYAETGFSFNLYALVGKAQEVEYPVPTGHGTHAHWGINGRISIEGRDNTASWDVLQHEWFHRVTMYVWDPTSMSWGPPGWGGSHWIQNAYNQGMALGEGLAEWNSYRAAWWAGRLAGEYNFFSMANSYNVDLESPTWGSAGWSNGDSVEGRVAGAIIDILDPANDGYDTFTAPQGVSEIWDMITKGSTGVVSRDSSFYEMYVDGWRARGHDNQGFISCAYQNTINYGFTAAITVTSSPTGSGFVRVDGVEITTPQTFTWDVGSTHIMEALSPISGGTGIQHVWVSWSDGGAQSHTITVPSSPTTYTANFKKQYMLTVSISPAGAGVLSASSGWRDDGTTVQVTATPNTGYSFYYWSLDGVNVGSSPSYSVPMNSPHSLTAFFRGTSTMSLGLSAESIALGASVTVSGTITPAQPSPEIPVGTTVVLSYSLDGSTWNIFIMTQTASGGAYSVVWYPPYPKTYQIKATWSGNANYEGSTSSSVSLTVTGTLPSRITLLVSGPTSALRGSVATFEVLVTNPGPPMSTTLYFEVIGPGGYWYFDAQQVSVEAGGTGRFQFAWHVASTASAGQYQVFVGLIPPKTASISQTQITVT